MDKITEIYNNGVVDALAKGLHEIKKDKNFNMMYYGQLYLDLQCNIHGRKDKLLGFVSKLLTIYDRCFNECLLKQEQADILINNCEDKIDIKAICDAILLKVCCA